MQWFHAIDFGGFGSSGRFRKGTPQNTTLYGTFEFLMALNLEGARVLDLGTVDGLVAFGCKRLGAAQVTATDTHARGTFALAKKLLGYSDEDIEYVAKVQVKDLPDRFDAKAFDLIVCAGILYHMLHPMQAFTDCRKVLGDGGYLVIETPFDASREEAVLVFNGVAHLLNEPYSYFIPSRSALVGMANLAGFEVCATRVLASPTRITLLLRATTREALCDDAAVAPFIKQMLKRDTCDDSFRHTALESVKRNARDLRGRTAEIPSFRTINPTTEAVTFPYHLVDDSVGMGTTMWEEVTGNTKVL
jgi:SAM-dependent methyltransferase